MRPSRSTRASDEELHKSRSTLPNISSLSARKICMNWINRLDPCLTTASTVQPQVQGEGGRKDLRLGGQAQRTGTRTQHQSQRRILAHLPIIAGRILTKQEFSSRMPLSLRIFQLWLTPLSNPKSPMLGRTSCPLYHRLFAMISLMLC